MRGHENIKQELCSSAWMGPRRIPEEGHTYFAPEKYTGFFYTVARRVQIY